MPLTNTSRQDGLLERLGDYVEASPAIGTLVVVGSFAAGNADAVSDLDLFFVTYPDRFEDAWNHRHELHVTGALVEWDVLEPASQRVGGHRWLSLDLVLVEAVISESDGGGRIAEPFRLVRGDPELLDQFPRREAIDVNEMSANGHPIDVAYDAFKQAVREGDPAHPPQPESP
jgi:predicted nucleotidyltransferase